MFLRHPLFSSYGIEHGFGLVSPPNNSERLVTARQVHGLDVVRVDPEGGERPEADGLWTDSPRTRVGVWTADCLPVLFSDRRGRVACAVHAGWRGAVRGIVHEALARLKDEQGLVSSDLLVVLGPSAGRCCYQVGQEVLSEVSSRYPGFRGRETIDGHLDLPALVLHQLGNEGIPAGQTGSIDLCTICHPELFFSHRRQGILREGRSMINWIQTSS
ncbi:MAG: peptidoglycan editing factor PgeF [Leptospirillum sp.]|nr:peptidoglycan editing factor PgeF [Nitrospiraceae bacterium]